MAKPTTVRFSEFVVKLGNGAGSEVFAAPCGFTQKALQLSAASSETQVPDCDNPEAPAWTERAVSSLSGQVTGQGVMAQEAYDTWRTWFLSGLEKNIRIELAGSDLGYYAGAAILTELGHSTALNSDGNKVQLSVTIANAGEWAWVDAA